MAYKDLRGFLDLLESENQLLRVKEEVMPEPDISAIGRATPDMDSAPAVMIENIKGYNTPLVLNVHGSWQNHALMLGLPKNTSIKDQFFNLKEKWDKYPIGPEWIDKKDAPVKENVITQEDGINLFDVLPLFRINEADAGFYLSKALIVSKDPDKPDNYDEQNIGTYRVQVKGKDKVGIQPIPFHDIAVHLQHAEEKDEPLPIAICLGNDPVLSFMASTPIEYVQSEYDFAGALKGEPIELTKSEHGNLDIPARSEIVLEGYIEPRKREIEGPFGEFPGSYSGARRQPTVKITKITHRTNPIFENLYLGMPWTEIDYLMALNTSLPLYKQLKRDFPEVEAVNAMYTHGIGTIVSTKSRLGGYGKAVAIIVDEFVDPFNLEQVMWAITTRVRPDKDVFKVPAAPGMPLDPSSEPAGMHTKLVIDATTPTGADKARDTNLLETPKNLDTWTKKLDELRNGEEK
ncbi:UbiD family decarboxylase [Staphylococcus pasteuri]|uniref:UbiD family decarboxylase n=1 Tax=Staphylococcus pasteuri TaxID=45972 RepID=A0ABY1H640_9STAP|nr:non-oxidative hydroxyarylic acid decarboxylases subunit C [Staphylococcus pasteuri]SFZ77877.1 UbiD family decarboxylase [Staphylococcus pasteuri]